MALNVLNNFFAVKSIKLSDAFAVYIKLKESSNFVEYTDCTGFTIPKFEQEEDLYTYGNMSQTFLIPKYDSCKEFSLTFYDTIDKPKEEFFLNNIVYKLNQNFNNDGLGSNYANYLQNNKIDTIKIKVADNLLHKFVYEYVFKDCKIVNYSLYNLDAQTDSPCQLTFNFSFESFAKNDLNEMPYTEPPKAEPIVQPQVHDPDGKVDFDFVNIDGVSYANKEELEIDYRDSITQEDMNVGKGEQLYQAAFSELEDIDIDSEDVEPELQASVWKEQTISKDLAAISNPALDLPDVDELMEDSSESNSELNTDIQVAKEAPPDTTNQVANVSPPEPKQEPVKKEEPTYSPNMLAEQAAKYDITNGTTKGQKGTYYAVGMNSMGTDVENRKQFDSAYTKYINKNAPG